MLQFLFSLAIVLGIASGGLGIISGIVCTIYDWAHAVPLWSGTILWLKMVGFGILSLTVGAVGIIALDKK